MSVATLTSKGQVTLPKKIRQMLHLEAGEKIDFRVDEKNGTAMMVPLNKHVDDVFGLLGRQKRRKAMKAEEMDRTVRAKFRKEYL